ncbi:major facilitator Super, partial [Perkinsus olseni]
GRLRYRLRTDPRRVADLGMVFSSVLVEWIGATLMAPITPWYVKKLAPNMGQGKAASVLMASYNIGMFVTSLFTGPLSDRVGRRPVFLIALLLYTGAQFADANAWDLASLGGFRALEGVLAGTRPVIIAYLSDISENDDMKLYGVIMGIFVVIGQLLGPVIGGALLQYSMWLPFYFMGILAAVLLLLEFFFLRESLVKDDNGKLVSRAKKAEEENVVFPKNKWLIPTVICLGIAAFCRQYVYLTWNTVFGLLGADRFHLSSSANGVVMGIQAAVAIVANIIYVPLTRILVPARIGCIGQLMCVVVVAVPWIYNLYAAVFLGMMVNIGGNLYFGGLAYFNA